MLALRIRPWHVLREVVVGGCRRTDRVASGLDAGVHGGSNSGELLAAGLRVLVR